MSVTSAYIECATGKRYHSIELADSFLLKYRYWTFAKITARRLCTYSCNLKPLEVSVVQSD